MNILINVGRFNGGAPLSILEYAKVAQKHGLNVIAVGEFRTAEFHYRDAGIKLYHLPHFSWKRPFENIKSILKYSQIIKREKPTLIHATSFGIIPSKFMNKLYSIPTLYSIAGGPGQGELSGTVLTDEDIIVYSEENKEDLVNSGYPTNRIQVVSNRIEVISVPKDYYEHYGAGMGTIKLLLISRLDPGLIQSIEYVLEITSELAAHYNIQLDIIGSGELESRVKKRANLMNNSSGKKIVHVHGFQKNVKKYIKEAHLVFGKGRSIIEAMLYNRFSFVVGEEKVIARCSPDTLSNLFKYNFSGRNIETTLSIGELRQFIKNMMMNQLDFRELEETQVTIDKLYNIKHVEEDIIQLYKGAAAPASSRGSSSKLIKASWFLIRLYLLRVFGSNRNIISKLFSKKQCT